MDEQSATLENVPQIWNENGSNISTNFPAIIISNLGPFDRYIDQIPLLGYPGPTFDLLHILALAALAASVLVSIILIIGLCFPRNPNKKGIDPASDRSAPRTPAAAKPGGSPDEAYTPVVLLEVAYQRTTGHLPSRGRLVLRDLSQPGSLLHVVRKDQSTGSSLFLLRFCSSRIQPGPVDHHHVHGRERVQSDCFHQEVGCGTDGLEADPGLFWISVGPGSNLFEHGTSRSKWSLVSVWIFLWHSNIDQNQET